jgi:uncharacterized protein (DUF2384 family)
MKIKSRRKYDKSYPGYMEGDKDYVLNNIDAAVKLLDIELARQAQVKSRVKDDDLRGKITVRFKVLRLLQSTFGFCDDDCYRWLRTPHDDLGGRTPKEVVEEGKGRIVIDMLEAAKAGQPS